MAIISETANARLGKGIFLQLGEAACASVVEVAQGDRPASQRDARRFAGQGVSAATDPAGDDLDAVHRNQPRQPALLQVAQVCEDEP